MYTCITKSVDDHRSCQKLIDCITNTKAITRRYYNATKCIVYISSDKKVRIILFILDFKIGNGRQSKRLLDDMEWIFLFLCFFLLIQRCCMKSVIGLGNISLTFNILHLRQGSFTRKVRTNFTLKIIVSMFVKLFMILVLHLRQCFIVIFFVVYKLYSCLMNLSVLKVNIYKNNRMST
jgi:hypothetical protein